VAKVLARGRCRAYLRPNAGLEEADEGQASDVSAVAQGRIARGYPHAYRNGVQRR